MQILSLAGKGSVINEVTANFQILKLIGMESSINANIDQVILLGDHLLITCWSVKKLTNKLAFLMKDELYVQNENIR